MRHPMFQQRWIRIVLEDGEAVRFPLEGDGCTGVRIPANAKFYDFYTLMWYVDQAGERSYISHTPFYEPETYRIGREYSKQELLSSGIPNAAQSEQILGMNEDRFLVYAAGGGIVFLTGSCRVVSPAQLNEMLAA